MILGVIGIFVSLIAIMVLAYRGVSVIVLAPLMAMFAVGLSGEAPVLVSYTEIFMESLGKFVVNYFPVFLLGALFGKIMEASGAASSISHAISRFFGKEAAIVSVVIATAVLVYGGISLFVVVFAVYPLAVTLFKDVDIPRRLIPGAIVLGAFTFAMTALPGTPQYINVMPTKYFGTNVFAAPVLGIIASVIMLGLGLAWLLYRAKSLKAKGEGFGPSRSSDPEFDAKDLPNPWLAILPIVIVFAVNWILTNHYFNASPERYLSAMQKLNKTGMNGLWPVIVALFLAIVVAGVVFYRHIKNFKEVLFSGSLGSLLPVFNTASEVGYGAVISSLAAFTVFKNAVISVKLPVLLKIAFTANVIAGAVGSSSGGTGILLEAMGSTFKQMAIDNGISLEAVHRIVLIAAGGLDTLPQCGAVITVLTVTGLTHKESYKDMAVCTIAVPLVSLAFVLIFASFGVV